MRLSASTTLCFGVRVAVVATLPLATSACSTLTDVDATGVVEPTSLHTPIGAGALFNGSLTLFSAAYNGNPINVAASHSAVAVVGLVTDELGTSGTTVDGPTLDSRTLNESGETFSGQELFTALSQARVNALAAAQVMQAVVPAASARIGQLFALAGYAELLVGELYCSGMTLTSVVNGAPVTYGTQLTSSDLFEQAMGNFDSALVYGVDSAAVANLARVGRARALLALGRLGEASAAVTTVATNYTYVTEHAAGVQPNFLSTGFTAGSFTVSQREGINGLDFRAAADPRVRTAFTRKGTDGVTDVWALTTLTAGQATPTLLASGIEARLIQAEAGLDANKNDAATTGSGWLGILNTLRATAITPAMSPLPDPGNYSARLELLFRERAFWLFATAHRLGDLRRLVRQYGRPADSVFPTGPWRGGTMYGTDVTLVPSLLIESRNPNYRGCLDRNP